MAALVVVAHAAVLMLLDASRPAPQPRRSEPRVTLRLIEPKTAAPAARPRSEARIDEQPTATPAPATRAARIAPRAPPRVAPADPQAISAPRIGTAPADTPNAPPPSVAAAAPAASAAADVGSILDTAASRRAIRASARAPSITAEIARTTGTAPAADAAERMGGAIKSAGKGDCAKGEFPGAGMGLLSLPFLAAAVARGDCSAQ